MPIIPNRCEVCMKVRELIEQLSEFPPEAIVVCSGDAEGNTYSPLSSLGVAVYVPENTWSGEVHVARTMTPELEADGYSEEDCYDGDDALDAVILRPVN
jgi:hypothetical protein